MNQNNGWSLALESEIKTIASYSLGMAWMTSKDKAIYSRIYLWLSNIVIILSVTAAVLGTVSLGINEGQQVIIAIVTVLTIATSLFEGFLRKMEFETKINELARQITRFSSLANNIKRQLGLANNDRQNAKDYVSWIQQSFDDLIESSIEPTYSVQDEYAKYCSKNDIPCPQNLSILELKDYWNLSQRSIKSDHKEDTSAIISNATAIKSNVDQEGINYTDYYMAYQIARLNRKI